MTWSKALRSRTVWLGTGRCSTWKTCQSPSNNWRRGFQGRTPALRTSPSSPWRWSPSPPSLRRWTRQARSGSATCSQWSPQRSGWCALEPCTERLCCTSLSSRSSSTSWPSATLSWGCWTSEAWRLSSQTCHYPQSHISVFTFFLLQKGGPGRAKWERHYERTADENWHKAPLWWRQSCHWEESYLVAAGWMILLNWFDLSVCRKRTFSLCDL